MRCILILRGLLTEDGMGGRVKEYDMGEGNREANVVGKEERLCERRCAIVIKESERRENKELG